MCAEGRAGKNKCQRHEIKGRSEGSTAPSWLAHTPGVSARHWDDGCGLLDGFKLSRRRLANLEASIPIPDLRVLSGG